VRLLPWITRVQHPSLLADAVLPPVIALEPISAVLMTAQSEKSATSKLLFRDSLTRPKANAGRRLHDVTLGGPNSLLLVRSTSPSVQPSFGTPLTIKFLVKIYLATASSPYPLLLYMLPLSFVLRTPSLATGPSSFARVADDERRS
jgi:hypothetical protein